MVRTPIRRCLSCRHPQPKTDLVRLVVAENTVVVDPEARRHGRGAYVCARPECLDAALKRGGAALARALRRPGVEVPQQAVRAGWRNACAPTQIAEGSTAAAPREEYE
ncbi:MAG TPA: YlxR family protein [Egibacteraceae bacterium]|nr:YlxR family protein [Egibacteraceae bacterium]